MNKTEARIARRAIKMIALGIVEEDVLHQSKVIDNLGDLEDKLDILLMRHQLSDTLDMTSEALGTYSENLANAHLAASRISVDGPTVNQINEFKAALNRLSNDIENNQEFRASFNLLLSLKKTISSLS